MRWPPGFNNRTCSLVRALRLDEPSVEALLYLRRWTDTQLARDGSLSNSMVHYNACVGDETHKVHETCVSTWRLVCSTQTPEIATVLSVRESKTASGGNIGLVDSEPTLLETCAVDQ